MSLPLPAASLERLVVPLNIAGVTNPQTVVVASCLSATATSPLVAAPSTGWQTASWLDDRNVLTHKVGGLSAGDYGLWLKLSYSDEIAVVFAGVVTVA